MSEYTKDQIAFLDEVYISPFSGITSVVEVRESLDRLTVTLNNPTPKELRNVALKLLELVGKYEYEHKAGSDTITFSYDKRYGQINTVIFPIGRRHLYELDQDDNLKDLF